MRDRFKALPILAILFIISSVLCMPGCVTDNKPAEVTPVPSTVAANVGGTLKYATAFGPDATLDPSQSWVGWYMREAGLYETLFSYDDKMQFQPELATKYEKISDTEWKVYLRDGVKFSDGTPMNAEAVVYSINRVINPGNTRSAEYSFIDSVSKYADNVVTIKTKYPYAPTIASLTDPITSIVSPNNKDINLTPVGTGPFKFVNYQKGVSLTIARNDYYWNGKSKLDGSIIYYLSDPMTRLIKLESGEVDVDYSIPQSEYAKMKNESGYSVYTNPTLRTYFFQINMYKKPYSDIRFRQALNYAINKQEVCDKALEVVGGTPATCVYPSVMSWSANDKVTGYQHDPQKAKELLAQVGFSDTNGDGWLEYEGQPFTLKINTYSFRPQYQPTAEVIASELQAVGINTKIEILDSGAMTAAMGSHNYDVVLTSWGVAPTGDPDYFCSRVFQTNGSEAKNMGYSDPEMDRLVKEGRETMDPATRETIYDQIQKKAVEDSPIICIFYQTTIDGTSNKVGGMKLYPNEITFLTKDIYLKK